MLKVLITLCIVLNAVYGSKYPHSYVLMDDGVKDFVISPLPSETVDFSTLPAAFDWRNVNGTNYVTVTRNQHLPVYCGSCWAFSTSSAFADRLKIASKAAWPEITLAPQVLVNCVGPNSTCHGGSPRAAYEYMRVHGIPDETCAPYEAADLACTPENICKTCDFDLSDPTKLCKAQPKFALHYVAEHGSVLGVQQMMAEINARGPIACVIAVTDAFETYSGGLFVDPTGRVAPDHVVSIVGWGSQNGVPYWIVRNSWGTFWGEKGYVRMVQGKNTLGIESLGCYWAVPKLAHQ